MATDKIFPLNLAKNTEELRKLILENPDLPIVILVSEDANSGDYGWQYCAKISVCIEQILDCEVPFSEYIQTDKDEFEERLEEWLWDALSSNSKGSTLTEEEFQELLAAEKEKYGQYWKKVIAISADN
uniref:Uncharacterized protein n=1 Tax=Dulem virus 37 TaxID=3145755 RepID=A0AAU8AXG6_9CAUD